MKKIWLLTSEYPPKHGGGISTYCLYTAQMFAEKGHQITVFTKDYGVDKIVVSENKNVRVIRFHPNQSGENNNLGYGAQLSLEASLVIEQFIRSDGAPDIIEMQEYAGIGYYTLLKKKLLYPEFKSVKMVVTMHAPSFLYHEYNRTPYYKFPEYWYGEMEKAVINMADVLISPSNYLIEELKQRMSFNGKEPLRIFNPFPKQDIPSPISEIETGDLVFFGKLTPQKGCLELFAYMKKLWDSGFEYPLRIVGGGSFFFYPEHCEMEVFLKRKYKKYVNAGKIVFEGNTPPDKLNDRLGKAQVIIVPSIVDNLPYAVIEVMQMGKIVLASRNSGHIELLVDGENGFLFDHAVKGDFSRQLLQILALSDTERIQISKKAQLKIAENLHYDKIYSEKMGLLNNLIDDNREFPFNHAIPLSEVHSKPSVAEKLCVIIPYYNLGETIDETVDSILKSDYPNLEIIIVDDGSTDAKSIKKLKRLEASVQLRVIRKENEGLSLARNSGAQEADGEYLAFLDADDTVESGYYSKAIEVLKAYDNVSFVGCWSQYFDNSTSVWPTFNPEPPYLLVHNMISSALIYKRDHFVSFGLNDEKLVYGMEDYDSIISMVKNGARGISLPEKLFNYRIRTNSMLRSFTLDKELFLYRLIACKHEAFFKNFALEISMLLNSNGSGLKFDNPTFPVHIDPVQVVIGEQPDFIENQGGNRKLTEVQEWYNQQYEVLPLWYKRFGHIVKIISGKRSLRKKNQL